MGEFLRGHKGILERCGIEELPERKGGIGELPWKAQG